MLQIIMAIEDEDDRSFVESLYNKYKGKMKQIAYDILQNEHDAQDCVHETIVIIIEKLERFKGTTDEESLKWLISVVCKNKAIDKYRKNKRQNMHQYSLTRYDLEEDDYIPMEEELQKENPVISMTGSKTITPPSYSGLAKEEKDRTEIDTGRMKLVFSGNDFPKFDSQFWPLGKQKSGKYGQHYIAGIYELR